MTPPANESQRGQGHFQVQLAVRPGAGGVYEAARIEQAGGDGQKPHHDEISELPHLMSLNFPFPWGGGSIAKSRIVRPTPRNA